MVRHDKQHYLSQSYLRNFSCDLKSYLEVRESLTPKEKKKLKRKMKIHFYDIQKKQLEYGKIESLARVNHYLLPTVDNIVKKTENKLNLLKEIIEKRKEGFLFQDNNQEMLWEIANSLRARSYTFREFIQRFTSHSVGEIVNKNSAVFGNVEYTDVAPELFQTCRFTDDPEILLPLFLRSIKVTIPGKKVNGTFEQILAANETEKRKVLEDLKIAFKFPLKTIIPKTVYPILIENKTKIPFITGDDCVPKGEFVLDDLTTTITPYYFPISPDLAIRFLEKEEWKEYFTRSITDEYEVYKMNRLIYNCSHFYIFSNKEKPLRLTTACHREATDWFGMYLKGRL